MNATIVPASAGLAEDLPLGQASGLYVDRRGHLLTSGGPLDCLETVVPDDDADINANGTPCLGLIVKVAGAVHYETVNRAGVRVEHTQTLAAGAQLPVKVYKVFATGTTATVAAGY